MILASTEHINPVQFQGSVVSAMVIGLLTLAAKGLEIIYARRKGKEDVDSTQARAKALDEETLRIFEELHERVETERQENKNLKNENHALREENLKLHGAVQALQLKYGEDENAADKKP